MLIAGLCVLAAFLIFIIVTYFMMRKDYKIEVEDKVFRIITKGSKLNIFINEQLVVSDAMPQLIYGEKYQVKFQEEEYEVKCQTNKFGNVLLVEIYKDGKLIKDNGKVLKTKKAN